MKTPEEFAGPIARYIGNSAPGSGVVADQLAKWIAERDAEWQAAIEGARAEGRLEGLIAGLSQGLAVVTPTGRRWLGERYKEAVAALATAKAEGEGTPPPHHKHDRCRRPMCSHRRWMHDGPDGRCGTGDGIHEGDCGCEGFVATPPAGDAK